MTATEQGDKTIAISACRVSHPEPERSIIRIPRRVSHLEPALTDRARAPPALNTGTYPS